jgi:hypothetical protein
MLIVSATLLVLFVPIELRTAGHRETHRGRVLHIIGLAQLVVVRVRISRNNCQASADVVQALKWGGRGSNLRPTDYQTVGLTAPDVTRFRLQDNEFDCPTAPVRTGRFPVIGGE